MPTAADTNKMKIYNLGDIDQNCIQAAGGKAKGLDKLIRKGFNAAPGFVLIDVNTKTDLEKAAAYYKKSGFKKVAVRSSAAAEDGVDFSYAGQFKTFLNIKETESFKAAVLECIESLSNVTAKSYTDRFDKNSEKKMSVIVQEMVEADFAGVCFSVDPGNPDNLLIEAVEGLGEELVSGKTTSIQYHVPRNIIENSNLKDFEALCQKNKLLTPQILRDICVQAVKMQTVFGMPLDTEWAVRDSVLYWLQARPITVLETCEEDEFDSKEDLKDNVITRCNIGEMLPGAVTPLTWSVSLYAIDWGIREMLRIAGAVKKIDDVPPYSCVFSTRGHLFMNLSTVYRMENAAFLTSKDQINFSICGRVLQEDGIIPGKKIWFLHKLVNTFKYLGFVLSRNKARKKLAIIADNFVIDRGQTDVHELYKTIDTARDTLNYVACLHYVTSAHSGAMSSSFLQILKKKMPDFEKCKVVLTEILERIDGIESVDILASLCRIAKAVLEENPQVALYDTRQLAEFLKTAGEKVKTEHNNFLTRHGHRAIREAELRNKGWAEDETAFIEYLKTVIISGNTEKKHKPVPDFKAILEGYGFKGGELKALIYLTKEAREGVKNREYSKSKLIKVLDGFKKAYMRLAVKLTEQGRLPDQDAVFFLTHQEIGELVKNENAALVKKAIQRRRLLKSQSELRFNEVYTNKPEPLPAPELTGTGVMYGTPISRGIATGPARVVRNTEDAALLQKGEIMVAVFTDIGWSPFYCLIEGLVTEIGGALSHGAVVAREYALPFVSNIPGITSLIRTGDIITVNGGVGCVTIDSQK